jgi:hypothetical protein
MPVLNLISLIRPDISDSDRWGAVALSWASEIGTRKAFRVRGFSWFANTVTARIADVSVTREEVTAELAKRTNWVSLALPWAEAFAPAQLYEVPRKKPMRLDKAAKAL